MSVVHEFKSPIEVVTPLGDGYLFYMQPGGLWGNDIYTVVLRDGGDIRHFRSDQIQMWSNGTWDITKKEGFQIKKPD
jgi:hypothetical protein